MGWRLRGAGRLGRLNLGNGFARQIQGLGEYCVAAGRDAEHHREIVAGNVQQNDIAVLCL